MEKQTKYLFWSVTDGVTNRASIPKYIALTCAAVFEIQLA